MPFAGDADAAETRSPGALRIEGQVFDGAGEPVPDALLEAWHGEQFARCGTDEEGAFHFTVRKPAAESDSAPFLNVTLFARGLLRPLHTRMYFPDEEQANRSDGVLQRVDSERRHTLVAQADGDTLRFDVHLQGDSETVFFAV
jgi:protocatechuate 3,4-dioxygenase alpha subunit